MLACQKSALAKFRNSLFCDSPKNHHISPVTILSGEQWRHCQAVDFRQPPNRDCAKKENGKLGSSNSTKSDVNPRFERIFAAIFSASAMENAFRRFGVVTVATVYLLIIVGGIVRSTGSGMGCPDWPKCFGQYVPPTAENQLPATYREDYTAQRKDKNLKFGKLLTRLGYADLANKITNDPSVYADEPFNATKTWIEYLNRLLGALTGVFILLTFAFSFGFWHKDRRVVWLSALALVLVLFEAGLGAIVVYTNLLPSTITIHMLGALAVVVVLIYAVARSRRTVAAPVVLGEQSLLKGLLLLNMGLFLGQVILGTQVREALDAVAGQLGEAARPTWIDQLGWEFYVHRSYSLLIFGLNFWFVRVLQRNLSTVTGGLSHQRWAQILLGLLAAEIATGAGMAYFAIPAILQPLHLGLAALIFGAQFWLWLLVGRSVPVPHDNFQNQMYAKVV